jgi:hypothetical protein
VVAGGPAVSQPFTFVANGTCGGTISATLHLQDGALDLGNVNYTFTLGTTVNSSMTFSNPAAITIPASGTGAATGSPATPYPSTITVAGAPTTISKITVTINNFNHTFPDDVDILLVSPTGRKMIIMSDAGSSTVATNLNITLDDASRVARWNRYCLRYLQVIELWHCPDFPRLLRWSIFDAADRRDRYAYFRLTGVAGNPNGV